MRRYAFTFLLVGTLLVAMATFGGCDEYAQTQAGLHNSYATPIPDYVPPPETLIHPPATTSTVPATTVVTHVIPATTVPNTARCPEWWPTMTAIWPEELWVQADHVMWAETRCQNLHRSNRGGVGYGDHGLFQVNAINLGYLSAWGITADDLMVPAMNMVAARILYVFAQDEYGCGWQPWYSSVDYVSMCDAVQH